MSDRLGDERKRGGSGGGTGSGRVASGEGAPTPGGTYRRGLRSHVDNGVGRELAANDPTWSMRYPALHDYLTRRVVDGRVIETATLLLFAEEGSFKACVNDREGDCVFFRSAGTLEDLLGACNEALQEGTADWRERKGGRR